MGIPIILNFILMKLLRIYLSNTDTIHGESLFEVISRRAQAEGLLGCTVLQGVMGYGSSSRLKSPKFWDVNLKYPIVVEIIDEEQRLRDFVEMIRPALESVHKGILCVLVDAEMVLKIEGKKK